MRFLATLGVLFLTGLAAGGFYMLSGAYNVAATEAHAGPLAWFLDTSMERSVRYHAEEVAIPDLSDAGLLESGFSHYDAMCAECHGAPGMEPSEVGQGLNPSPPLLTEEAPEWTPAELFWIVKHGVKMTGMPAFGPTHEDGDLWALVAFLQELPTMSPEEYRTMAESAARRRAGEDEHHHAQDDAEPHPPQSQP